MDVRARLRGVVSLLVATAIAALLALASTASSGVKRSPDFVNGAVERTERNAISQSAIKCSVFESPPAAATSSLTGAGRRFRPPPSFCSRAAEVFTKGEKRISGIPLGD